MAGLLDYIEAPFHALGGLLGTGGAPMPGAADAPQAPPAAPPQAQAPGYAPPPVMPQRGLLGDVLDSTLLGGAIQRHAANEYARQVQAYNGQRLTQIYAALPDEQKLAFQMDPAGYMAEIEKGVGPQTVKDTERLIRNPLSGGNVDAQHLGQTAQGATFTQTQGGLTANTGGPGSVITAPVTDSVTQYTPRPSPGLGPQGGPPPGAPMIGGAPAPPAPPAPPAAPTAAPGPQGSAPQAVANSIFTAAKNAGLQDGDARNLVAIGKLESGLNPAGPANGLSTGLFQMHPATFKNLGGANINDPGQQTAAAIKLYQQNQQLLGAAGLPVNSTSLYLAHQQGFPAAKALLGSDPNKNAVQTLVDAKVYRDPASARRAIVNNFGSADMTNGQFLQMWQGKVARRLKDVGGVGEAQAATAAPSSPSPAPAQPPPQIGAPPPAQAGSSLKTLIPGKTARTLSAKEATDAGFPPGAVVQQAPDGSYAVKADGFTPQVLDSVRGDVVKSKQYDEYTQGNDAYKAMISAANLRPGGMRAYALRDTFARVINPGAVARVGTIQAIKEAQGIPAAVQAFFMNLKGDGDVPPQIAQQILDVAQGFAKSHYDSAKALNDANAQVYTPLGVDPRRVTAPMDDEPARFVLGAGPVLDPARAAKLRPGTSFVGLDGKKRVRK